MVVAALTWCGGAWAAGTETVDRAACARLVDHVPAADVAYRPGGDKGVVPADGGVTPAIQVPTSIDFNPSINPIGYGTRKTLNAQKAALATQAGTQDQQAVIDQKLAGQSAKGLDATSMPVGAVHFDINTGQLTFNGQPLSGAQTAALDQACRKAGFR